MRWIMLAAVGMLLSSATFAQMMPGGGVGGGGGMGSGGMGSGRGGRGGHGGQSGGDRSGGPGQYKPPKPLKREKLDKAVAAMFRAADANHDGTVTPDELGAVIDGRREAVIRARFARIDTNRDGRIDPAEFSTWQRRMGSVALSEAGALGTDGGPVPEAIEPVLGDGPDDRLLSRLIEPLSATVIAKANVNYDAGVTLDELLAYEHQRFDAADQNHDGELTMDEARDLGGPDGRRGPGDGFGGRGRPPGGAPLDS